MDIKYVVVPACGEEDPAWFHEIRPPVLCESKGRAEEALAEICGRDGTCGHWDWTVFEVIEGRCRQASVIFKDGRPEIQPV